MKLASEYYGHQLLIAIAEGNQQAFCSLFEAYKNKVYSYSLQFTRSSVDAEEITQEVFLKIWSGRSSLPKIENIEAWISVVTRNLCFNHLKKIALEKKHVQHITQKNAVVEENVQQYISYKEQLSLLGEALDQLSPQQRLVYSLNREEGLKNDEIARRLNISTNTVKTHLVSALRKIRHFLETHPAHIITAVFFLSKNIF
jgi:RNA polymerase sigma-70 factor (family 1)